jgi:hypothetical protein
VVMTANAGGEERDRPAGPPRAAGGPESELNPLQRLILERLRERELLIASIDELTPEDRRHVAALVESLRNKESPPPADGLAAA